MRIIRFLLFTSAVCLLQFGIVFAQAVFVNQAGYLPDQSKFCYSVEGADSFYVADASTGSIKFRAAFTPGVTQDPATGLTTFIGDFTSFTEEGKFVIITSNSNTSYSFTIGDTAFESVYKAAMKGFYFQRCGTALTSEYAGVYARAVCHTHDAVYHSTTGKAGSVVETGGWHDAGDYGKYVVNAGITVGTLLLGYEMFPSKFKYDDLNIPESGNGIPDLLDEVRYELQWMLEMQDTSDGGVYFKVTPANFAGFIMPASDNSTRYLYQKSTTATGDFAAVMAQAGRIYEKFDTAFASKCLTAAELAWQYLAANPTIVPVGGFKNPAGTYTGEYGDGNDSDERLWAAAELYESTGLAVYENYFQSNYNKSGVFTSTMGWPNVADLAQIAYLTGKQAGADATVKSELLSALKKYCDALVSIASADGLNVSIIPSQYGWGSNSAVLNNAVLLVVGYSLSGTDSYYRTALQQLNYILGCNRLNISFVTGIGTSSPMNPHHRPSYADGIEAPIPGLLVGGPDEYLDDAVLKAHFTSSTPPARCYVDDWQSYASNEIAINWNAPLVFVAGYMNESPATPVRTSGPTVPTDYSLTQNYPNPFNPTTTIKFAVPGSGSQIQPGSGRFVVLAVYDIMGRLVKTLVSSRQTRGEHIVVFDGRGLASGIYICRLYAGGTLITRKMMLLK